ncbi:glycosyltransferase [Hippea alviniae]|uniref:glycosyltransferase n=1 Tax=Hippea alviniae TaxID=1279027 RepID=UPI0003B792B3|nr:glycosyltransferase [Hippea alviniae]
MKLYTALRKLKPDVVFSGIAHVNLIVGMLIPLLPKEIKFIARETNIPSINNRREKFRHFDKILYMFYNNFNAIVSQSKFMKRDLILNFGIKPNIIHVIPNPIDIENIKSKSACKDSLLRYGDRRLLFVGRMEYQKGCDLLIKSLSLMKKDYHLYIIGDGKDKNSVISLADSLNVKKRVHLLGFKTNPYKYMSQADLLILPSRYEGLPNVVLEANACGIPVVAFGCPGGTVDVIKNGVNGFLAKCEDTYDLANTVETAIRYKWDKEEIIEHALRFDVKYIGLMYEKLLQI